MAKKQQSMENKLGSWAEQANLTRSQSTVEKKTPTAAANPQARQTYPVARSLLERIDKVATAHAMTQNELVGYLLTWSLDQVESGNHQIEKK